MDAICPKYFDYLDQYGAKLQAHFRYVKLTSIPFWRIHGIEEPDSAAHFCRKTLEGIVDDLLSGMNLPERTSLDDKIWHAYNDGLIEKPFHDKYHQIRRTGNDGTHKSVIVAEAKMCMELLDDVLYDFIFRLGLSKGPKKIRRVEGDSVFFACDPRETEILSKRAKIASAVSKDSTIEKRAEKAIAEAEKKQVALSDVLAKIEEVVLDLGKDHPNKEEIHNRCDDLLDALQQDTARGIEEIREARAEVEEMISEHDFIKKLLAGRGGGEANDEQLDVMAFPKTAQASTTMLLLRGGAGTGKTLCLLAKLIKQVEDVTDGDDPDEKRGLFVCFNKNLSSHVDDLLRDFPQARERIDVLSFDSMINQLVTPTPDEDSCHKSFAADVRFAPRWKILYESSRDKTPYKYVKQAMKEVGKRYPQKKGVYYLEYESNESAEWVRDEISWIEAKYDSFEQAAANYPKAARTGRSSVRRPNAEARKIILEVMSSYHSALSQGKRYTIEQAMKRILESKELPQYDAIAIDEVQDLSLLAIKAILKLRKGPDSWVYISGDENQKIYQRDFTWKELGDGARGFTITLHENKRNVAAVEAFASRLTGENQSMPDNAGNVVVGRMSEAEIGEIVANLKREHPNDSIAYIGYSRGRKIDASVCVSPWQPKGLEYDTVIVDCSASLDEDFEAETRLRYVHFTRARKRLYVTYRKSPSELLTTYYPDFL